MSVSRAQHTVQARRVGGSGGRQARHSVPSIVSQGFRVFHCNLHPTSCIAQTLLGYRLHIFLARSPQSRFHLLARRLSIPSELLCALGMGMFAPPPMASAMERPWYLQIRTWQITRALLSDGWREYKSFRAAQCWTYKSFPPQIPHGVQRARSGAAQCAR